MLRKGSIAPSPASRIINIHTLNQALHPGHQEGDDSRSTTPGIEPQETHFLAEFDNLTFSHNFKEECCNCPCRTVVDIKTLDKMLVMQGVQKIGCFMNENIEIFNNFNNELSILIEFIGGGCCSVPNRIQVYAPPGYSVGFIEKIATCCSSPSFEIQNPSSDTIYTVQPLLRLFGISEFPIIATAGDQKVGEITSRRACSYTLNYIERLHPSIKALLIGFTFYLDMLETRQRAVRNGYI